MEIKCILHQKQSYLNFITSHLLIKYAFQSLITRAWNKKKKE